MKPQSDPRIDVLLNYLPLNFLVIGRLEMGTIFQYPLMIEHCKFHILGLNSKHKVQKNTPYNHW